MDRDLNFSSPESLAVELDQARVSKVCPRLYSCGHTLQFTPDILLLGVY